MFRVIARYRWMVSVGCVLLLMVPLSCVPVAADSLSSPLGIEEQAVWTLITIARRDAGLPMPATDAQIISLARDRSRDMATRHYFGHFAPGGQSFLDLMPGYGLAGQVAGETIQENNLANSPAEAARALIASPEHHAILFDPRYTVGGIGHALDGNGVHYFTIIVVQP